MFRGSFLALALLALAALSPLLPQARATNQNFSFARTISFDGVTVTVTSSFKLDTTTKTLTGTASVTVVNSTTGQTIASKTFTINLVFGTSGSIKFVLAVPSTPLMIGISCGFTIGATPAAVCTVSRDPDVDHDGAVDFGDVTNMLFAYGAVQGSANYNPALDLNANGQIDFGDVTILLADYQVPVF